MIQRELAFFAPLLTVGCSTPPPEVPPPPPPAQAKAQPQAIEPVKDEGDAKAGVGPLVQVDETVEERAFEYNFVYQAVPSGPGVFSFYEFEQENPTDGAPACSLKTDSPNVCLAFSFAPWKGAPVWPRGWLPERSGGRLEKDGKLTASPRNWQRFSPGKEGIYASREVDFWTDEAPPLEIDFIRPDGTIEPFLKDTARRFSDAFVVEVPGGHLGIFRLIPIPAENRMYRSVGGLVAAPIVTSGKERKVGTLQKLDIGDIWYDGRASDARDARGAHKRANYGPFRAVALLDAQGKPSGDVALVWVEAFPPPSHDELEKKKTEVRRGKSKHQCGRPDRSTFADRSSKRRPFYGDGCGGRASRSLSSKDVQKRLHVTRLTPTGTPKEDRSVELPLDYKAEQNTLAVFAQPGGGLVVDHMTFDGQLRRGKDVEARPNAALEPPPFEGPRPQRLLQATFDQRSGEAMLLYGEAVDMAYSPTASMVDAVMARTVSALGKPLGKPLALPEYREQTELPVAGRGSDAWLLVEPSAPTSFRVVGGPHHQAQHPFSAPPCEGDGCASTLLSVVPAPGGGVELITKIDARKNPSMYSTMISLDTLLSAAPRALGKFMPDEPPLFDNRGELRGEDGSPLRWTLADDGSASLVDPAKKQAEDGPKEASEEGKSSKDTKKKPEFGWEQHQVWGDVVIVATRGKQVRATWLKARQTVDFETDKMSDEEGFLRIRGRIEAGPVLPGGEWILPATPGQPIAAPPGLRAALKGCPAQMATGPRRLLLACSEAVDDQRPAVRVGTRVVRY